MRVLVLFTFLSLAASSGARASHILGADITWECLGNGSFRFFVNAYRDCNGTGLDFITKIDLLSNGEKKSVTIKPIDTLDITLLCNGDTSRCADRQSNFDYGVAKEILSGVVDLSDWKAKKYCDVYIEYDIGFRSNYITTGGRADALKARCYLNLCEYCVSSIKWNTDPKTLICLGHDTELDFGASPGRFGDSLVFELDTSKGRYGNPIQWSSSYDFYKPFYFLGFPDTSRALPFGFHLNKAKGLLRFRPMKTETTILTVRVSAYRNGKLVSSTIRDHMVTVRKCSPGLEVLSTHCGSNSCNIAACPGDSIDFTIYTKKGNGDTVRLTSDMNIDGAKMAYTQSDTDQDEMRFTWKVKYKDAQKEPHRFTVTATDNQTCPSQGKAHKAYYVTVKHKHPDLAIKISPLNKCGYYVFKAFSKTDRTFNPPKWYVNDTLIGTRDSVYHEFKRKGKYEIKAVHEGCTDTTLVQTLDVERGNSLFFDLEDLYICRKDTMRLILDVKGIDAPVTYHWEIDTTIMKGYQPTTKDLLFLGKQLPEYPRGNYSLSISDTNGCKFSERAYLSILQVLDHTIAADTTLCQNQGNFFALATYWSKNEWYGPAVEGKSINLYKVPAGTHTYLYVGKSNWNCYLDTIEITIKPAIDVSAGPDVDACFAYSGIRLTQGSPPGGTWTGKTVVANKFYPKSAGVGSTNPLIYRLKGTNGCVGIDTMNATVVNQTKIKMVTKISVCSSDPDVVISASPPVGEWLWNSQITTDSTLTISPKSFRTGTFDYRYSIDDSMYCKAQASGKITITEDPIADFDVKDTLLTQGDTLNLRALGTFNGVMRFSWEVGNPSFLFGDQRNFNKIIGREGKHDIKLRVIHWESGCADSLTKTAAIRVQKKPDPESVAESGADVLYSVYPNPVGQELYITLKTEKAAEIKLFALDGRLLVKQSIEGLGAIDLNTVPKGVYRVEIDIKGKSYAELIIKE